MNYYYKNYGRSGWTITNGELESDFFPDDLTISRRTRTTTSWRRLI